MADIELMSGFGAIKRGATILAALGNAEVLDVERLPDGTVKLTEGCDRYFSVILTREQVIALADEIKALVEERK